MSVLVVGLSHKGTPLATLERVALPGDALDKLLHDVSRADDVAGALVLSTCNRVEIYAEVDKFHGAVTAICELLSRHSQVPPADLTPYLYVHYQDRAVQHLLAVACGLDSMVIGESQILGQLRHALHLARERGTLGRALADLGSLALRAGKRAQSQTSIGAAGASLVSVGLQVATRHLEGNGAAGARGASSPLAAELAGKRVLVVGAGAMSGLAVASVARAGAAGLTVASRTLQRAQRLASSFHGRATDMSDLAAELAAADLVVSCTGASGHVITADMVADAMRQRSSGLVLLDLAMPRNADRRGPARQSRQGRRRRDRPPSGPSRRARRCRHGRDSEVHAESDRQAAARSDRADQGTGRVTGRRQLRGCPARPLRPRPRRGAGGSAG